MTYYNWMGSPTNALLANPFLISGPRCIRLSYRRATTNVMIVVNRKSFYQKSLQRQTQNVFVI